MDAKQQRVDELDGLRGILATWVALSHILCWTGFCDARAGLLFPNFYAGLVYAQPAVQIFIILSGFAISFLLARQKQSYWTFIRGRFFRLYPVYFICLALGIATSYLIPFILNQASWQHATYFQTMNVELIRQSRHLLVHILSSLTLLNGVLSRSMLPGASTAFLPPAWSITLEWQYYLVAPVIALFVRSTAGLLFLGAVAYAGILLQIHWSNPAVAFLPVYLPLFLVGIASYHFFTYFISTDREAASRFIIPVATFLTAAALFSAYSLALATWGLVWCCILTRGQGPFASWFSLLRRLLLSRWLQLLGRMSYPIYLIHWPVIIVYLYLLVRWNPLMTPAATLACLLILVLPTIFVGGWLLHKYVEEPLNRLGKKRGGQAGALISKTSVAPLSQ